MAVAYQSKSEYAWVNSGDEFITITPPSGITDGDLLLASITYTTGSGVTLSSAPSGWTLIESSTDTNYRMYTYRKTASSESGSYTWELTGSPSDKAGIILRLDGQVTASPIGDSTEDDQLNSETPAWTPGITPTVADSMLVMFAAGYNQTTAGTSGYAITTSNPTWTERADITSGSTLSFGIATAIRPETTATGDYTATFTGVSTDSVAHLIAVSPRVDADGNHAILTSTSEIFAHTISIGTSASHAILTSEHEIFTNSGKSVDQTKRWTNNEKGTKTWTNQKKYE